MGMMSRSICGSKYWIFLVVFLWAQLNVCAQEAIILDQERKEPVAYALVTTNESIIVADSLGRFKVSGIAGKMEISSLGYERIILYAEDLSDTVLLKRRNNTLKEVVVSAKSDKQDISGISKSIVQIDQKTIAFVQPQTSADLLMQSGKVFVQKSQLGGGSPMIRGFAANRVLLSVDGVRMNNAIFRSGNLQNILNIDPFSLEQADVIFGPGSLIYGSDAIGGVLSFRTIKPEYGSNQKEQFSGVANLRTSTANWEKSGHIHLNFGLSKVAFLTSVSYNDYDDLKMGSNGPEDYLRPFYVERIAGYDSIFVNPDPEVQNPTGFDQLNFLQKINVRPTENMELSYAFHYSNTSNYPRYDRLIQLHENLPRYATWDYGPQKWLMNHLQLYQRKMSPWFDEMKLSFALQHFEESRISRDFQSDIRSERTEQVHVLSGNLDFGKSFSDHIFNYGIATIFNRVNSAGLEKNIITGLAQEGPSRYPNNSRWDSYAFYFSHTYLYSPSLVLQSGLRYSLISLRAQLSNNFYDFPFNRTENLNHSVTGSLGLVYNGNENSTIKFNLSTGFRAPNIDDIGKVFDSSPGFVVVPNPELRPEYAYNGDFYVGQQLNDHFKLALNGFYTFLDQAMTRSDFQLNGQDSILYDGVQSKVQAIQNSSYAMAYGFGMELSFDYNQFHLMSAVNYQQGKEKLSDGQLSALRHVAPTFGKVQLAYHSQAWKVSLSGMFNGSIHNRNLAVEEKDKPFLYAKNPNGDPYSPKWYTLNFNSQYQFNSNIQLVFGIENITDQRYRPYSSGIAAAGRNFMLTLGIDF